MQAQVRFKCRSDGFFNINHFDISFLCRSRARSKVCFYVFADEWIRNVFFLLRHPNACLFQPLFWGELCKHLLEKQSIETTSRTNANTQRQRHILNVLASSYLHTKGINNFPLMPIDDSYDVWIRHLRAAKKRKISKLSPLCWSQFYY